MVTYWYQWHHKDGNLWVSGYPRASCVSFIAVRVLLQHCVSACEWYGIVQAPACRVVEAGMRI